MWEISVPSARYCSEAKTAPKIKSIKKLFPSFSFYSLPLDQLLLSNQNLFSVFCPAQLRQRSKTPATTILPYWFISLSCFLCKHLSRVSLYAPWPHLLLSLRILSHQQCGFHPSYTDSVVNDEFMLSDLMGIFWSLSYLNSCWNWNFVLIFSELPLPCFFDTFSPPTH